METIINEFLRQKSSLQNEIVIQITNRGQIITNSSPHGNCQTASIAFFNELLTLKDSDIRKCIIDIHDDYLGGKPQLLLDVETAHESRIRQLFSDCIIVVESPYISTNDSSMTIYLIDIRGITGYEDDEDDY